MFTVHSPLLGNEKVTVAIFPGAAPVSYVTPDGKAAGIYAEVLARILKAKGYSCEFKTGYTFKDAFRRVVEGKITIMPALIKSKQRQKLMDFNRIPIVISWGQIFTGLDSRIDSLIELRNKKIAMMRLGQNGINFSRMMKKFGIPFQPVYYPDFKRITQAILSKEVDAGVSFSLYYKKEPRLKPSGIIFSPSPSYIAVKKGTHGWLLRVIDREMIRLKKDPDSYYYKILEKHMIVQTRRILPKGLVYTIFGTLLAVFIMILFVFLLKREARKAKLELYESEERYGILFQKGKDAVFLQEFTGDGKQGAFLEVNDAACEMLKYSRSELLQMNIEDSIDTISTPQDRAEIVSEIRHSGSVRYETDFLASDNTQIPVEINAHCFSLKQQSVILSMVRDITDRKKAEENMRNSVREKETLLKEIHHRVKNNLQMVASLVNMQSYYIDDENVKHHLQDTAERVRSMGLIHKQLYQSPDITTVDFYEYVHNITDQLQASHVMHPKIIQISVDISDISFNIDTAIPCGLIINEILTNAMKHAFPDNRVGKIEIRLLELPGRQFQLNIADNGVGLPADVDINRNCGLGFKLISILSEQLHGRIGINRNAGTAFILQFREIGV